MSEGQASATDATEAMNAHLIKLGPEFVIAKSYPVFGQPALKVS